MNPKDRLLLPPDVVIASVSSFDSRTTKGLNVKATDKIITRPRLRARSIVVDGQAAAFLEQFRSPATVIEAVLRHSAASGDDPGQVLEAGVPLVLRLRRCQMVVVEGEMGSAPIQPTFAPGEKVAGAEIIRCIHLFDDVEVYRARISLNEYAALKILRHSCSPASEQMLEREAAILEYLAGTQAPFLLTRSEIDGRAYLLQSWCDGINAARAAAVRRAVTSTICPPEVLALCAEILRTYAELHERGVIHGDVHPGNILVGKDGGVTLIDFGIAISDAASHLPLPGRAGLHDYLEPEYCRAVLMGRTPPTATPQSDQYALGALLYRLVTGAPRQDFNLQREAWLRQVAKGALLPFTSREQEAWPEMEDLLARALATHPSNRFASTRQLLGAFENITTGKRAAKWSEPENVEFFASVLHKLTPKELPFDTSIIARLEAPRCSINYGAAGIAWFLYRVAAMRDEPRLLAAADVWCSQALKLVSEQAAFASSDLGITRELTGSISPFHSVSGIHLVQAHVSRAMGDETGFNSALLAFITACNEFCDNPDLTLGWASALLGCAALVELSPEDSTTNYPELSELGRRFAGQIVQWLSDHRISTDDKMRWLGLAHGWGGLLLALLRWTEATGDPLPQIAQQRLQDLAALGVRKADEVFWPLRLGNDPGDRRPLTGWCHGSAGYLLLWTLAQRVTGNNAFFSLALGCGRHLKTSMLSETSMDPSLCCGYSGQGFAMLALYRATGEDEPLRLAGELSQRAVRFASNTTRPYSLYKGHVGIALLLQELAQPLNARMPLVESEGWLSDTLSALPV